MKLLTCVCMLSCILALSCKKDFKPTSGNEVSSIQKNPKAEEAFPGQTGESRQGYLFGEKIGFHRINGLNVLEGDILLPDKWISSTPLTGVATDGAVISTVYSNIRWPNNVIPYAIEAGFPDVWRITDAIADWEAHTPFRFVARTTETDYVFFDSTLNRNASYVGRIGGAQNIWISIFEPAGVIVHEIGHAAGLWHEHQRADRNSFIDIHEENIIPGVEDNFNRYSDNGYWGFDAEPFDFGSIMMYPSDAFSIDPFTPLPTITRLNGSLFTAQRTGLSAIDMDVATCIIGFSAWENLGGNLVSSPVAVSRANNSVNIFGRGISNQLMHIYWGGSSWSNWEDLGGSFQDAPVVSRRSSAILDVFVRGTDNHLYHRYWNNSWSNWMDLGGNITSSPAAVSRTSTTINVFAKGTSNQLMHKYWNGSSWSNWEDLGGSLASAPTAASWGANRLDVFYQGASNSLVQKAWTGSWQSATILNYDVFSSPSAVSWGSNRIDIFYRRADGLLNHKCWDNTAWLLRPFGGALTTGSPAIASQSNNHLDLFATNSNGQLMHKWY